jgi:hypothetical protein
MNLSTPSPKKPPLTRVEFLKVINRYSMCLSTPEHVVYQHIDNSTNSNKLSYKQKKIDKNYILARNKNTNLPPSPPLPTTKTYIYQRLMLQITKPKRNKKKC